MIIFLNNISFEFAHEISISELLSIQKINAERGVAIAVNNTVIQKKLWEIHTVKNNDNVTIIRATQGG